MYKDFIKEVILPTVVIFAIFFGLISIPIYYSACKKAQIYNKQNGTEYTCADFFWASQQINSQTQTIRIK